ncbi:sialic acid-binding Ig-like lectin 14 [Anolis sagrei]|uniref:sialic acid-binding Ig-like lectin 14 n=1 Tax=Anolis sagrei TaxID=38937 RepID=UPI00352041C2
MELLQIGVLSQHADYTLTATAFVSVQRGLQVHIPCQFTYNKQHANSFSTFYGYWFKNKKEPVQCASVPSQSQGLLVATNNEGQTIKESTKNRIQLDGDVEQGNCSFQINDAQLEDEGSYYFRVEQGDILKYSFYLKTLQVTVTDYLRPSSTHPANCIHEDNALSCICSFQSQVPAQIQWQVEGETLSGNSTRGALQVMSWVHTNVVVSSLNFSGNLEGGQPLICLGSNAFGTYVVHFRLSSPTKDYLQPSSTHPANCIHEDNALFCICSFQSQVPAQIQWQVEGETLSGNSTRGALQTMSWVRTNEVVSSLNFSGSLEGGQPLICLGSNALGTYAVHFRLNSPTKDAYVTILVSAVCGSLITASIFLLSLCLSRLRKTQKEKQEKEEKESSYNMRAHQAMDENNAIYCNVQPMRCYARSKF